MKTSMPAMANNDSSPLESALHDYKKAFRAGGVTGKDIEKLATKTILSMDKFMSGRKYEKHSLINAGELCRLMKDMGMIADAGKAKKDWPGPNGGAGSQAVNFCLWQVDNTTYPAAAAAEHTFRLF